MNILENKRVVGLSAVFALAFGGLVYYGFGRTADFAAAKTALNSINEQVLEFEQAEFPPTESTRKSVRAAAKKVNETLAALKKDFASYADKCVGDGKVISSVDFQNEVRGTIDDLGRSASEKGCQLGSAAADLGMGAYKNSAATAEEVPFRSFQLKAAKRVADVVVDSGSPLLDKVYCAPLPEEKARKKAAHFPLGIEVAFTAKRSEVVDGQVPVSVLPKVLNALSTDKDFFFKITGLWVGTNEGNLPPIDSTQPASQDPNQGDELGSEGPAPVPEGQQIAVRKTGSPDETVRVHINLQVLYFTANSSKK